MMWGRVDVAMGKRVVGGGNDVRPDGRDNE